MAEFETEQYSVLFELVHNEDEEAEIVTHLEPEQSAKVKLLFEVPRDIVEQVYEVDKSATFVENLRVCVDKAQRYDSVSK